MSEAIYDAEIAPELLRLATRCNDLGLPFLAIVEFERGKRGSTGHAPDKDNLAMRMAWMVAHYGERIDDLIFAILRILRAEQRDHSCVTLKMLGLEPLAKDRVRELAADKRKEKPND